MTTTRVPQRERTTRRPRLDSSGAIGRPVPDDVIGQVRYYLERGPERHYLENSTIG